MSRVALPVQLDAPTRNTLDKLIRSSSTPQSLALRSRIVLAAADGVSNQEIAAALKVPAIRTFTFSPDPDFEAKLLDLVGLYLNPPENALVLCVDEKPGIQALDRTQGTQTLLAALEIATGKVVAHVRDRRTTVDFLGFMDEVVKSYPPR